MAVVTFSDFAQAEFYLDEYFTLESLTDAMNQITVSTGETNIFAGLNVARTEVFNMDRGDRPDAKNMAVLVTDGQSNINVGRARTEAERARYEGIEIISVGVTVAVDTEELLMIAGAENNVLVALDYVELLTLVDSLVQKACDRDPINDLLEGK